MYKYYTIGSDINGVILQMIIAYNSNYQQIYFKIDSSKGRIDFFEIIIANLSKKIEITADDYAKIYKHIYDYYFNKGTYTSKHSIDPRQSPIYSKYQKIMLLK